MLPRLHLRAILCVVDFSDASRRALAAAAVVARQFDGDLWVLHVAEAAMRPGRLLPPWSSLGPGGQEREQLMHRLRSFVRESPAQGSVTSVALRHGEAVRETLRYARTLGADLIVIGVSGDADHSSQVPAPLPERLSALGSTPLLVVPGGAPLPTHDSPWLTQVVCAVDLSPGSRAALNFGVRLVLETEGELTVLHVHEPHLVSDASIEPPRHARLDAQRLRMLVPAGVDRWCDVHYLVVQGSPAAEIAAVARRTAADLIVIGGERRPAGADSIARALLRMCAAPVLIASVSPRLQAPSPDWTGASEPLGAA